MNVGSGSLSNVRLGSAEVQMGRIGPVLFWQRSAPEPTGEIVISADGFLVKEDDGYLVI